MMPFDKKAKSEVHYFMTNLEFRSMSQNTQLVCQGFKSIKLSSVLFLTQFLQNYFFFLICKAGNDQLYLAGLCAYVLMTGLTVIKGNKSKTVRSKTSLAFMGLLDIVYFYMLLGTGHYLSSFVFATQLQTTLFIRVFLLKVILTNPFRFTQYLGAIIILTGSILNLAQFGDRYTYLLLLGMVLHCINNIIKRHYIKKFQVQCLAMNKYALLFATGFGIIITPLLSLLVSESIGDSLIAELNCLVGIDCRLMPLYIALLVFSAAVHQVVLDRSKTELEGHKIVYLFSSVIAFLGFFCAEATLQEQTIDTIKIICAVLAIAGSIIYHIYPEIPQKFSYSDN